MHATLSSDNIHYSMPLNPLHFSHATQSHTLSVTHLTLNHTFIRLAQRQLVHARLQLLHARAESLDFAHDLFDSGSILNEK